MFIQLLRHVVLAVFLLALCGCACGPKVKRSSCECPLDPCARSCPPPRDCAPTVEQINQMENQCGGWGTHRAIFELRKHGVQVIEIGENAIILLPADRFFEVNCAAIREDAYSTLTCLVYLLTRYGCVPLYISAHTDNVAGTCFNCALSDARAQAIQAYLWVRGIHFRRMCATGCANCVPIANQVTVLGNAANRRIEIRIRKTCCCG